MKNVPLSTHTCFGNMRLCATLLRGLAVLAVSCCAQAKAADKPQIGSPPAWVKQAEIPADTSSSSEAAIREILNDQQANLSPAADEYYSERIVRVQTARGLQDMGTISLPWNPDISTLTVHKLHILRQGQVIDVLGGGQGFTVLRRENNLEGAALDGVLTAVIQPIGLQVGDVIDLATTLRSSDPAMAGRSEMTLNFWPVQPTAHLRMSARWAKGTSISWKANAGMSGAHQISTPDGTQVVLAMDNVEPELAPKGAPQRYQQTRHIDFTSFHSWAEIAAQFAPLFQKAARLSPQSPLQQEIARIRAATPDPVARTEAALALVQDQVRYFYLGTNDGGLVPADAGTTWARRFGDCEGKTVLLLALLQGLGVDATPVLASAGAGDGLDEHLPMAGVFDHVLIRSVIRGRTYWLDGTRTGDRHLADIAVPAFYWGLPLVAQGSTLVPMKPTPLSQPSSETSIRIDMTAGLTVPAPFYGQVVMRGDSANVLRLKFADISMAQLDQGLRAFWTRAYDYVKITTVHVKYDEASGQEVLTMDGKAQLPWSGWRAELTGLRVGYLADFERPAGPGHDAPYAVPFPMFISASQTILLPANGVGFTVEADQVDRTIAGVHYSRSAQIHANTVTAMASARSLEPEFPASEAVDAQAALREMWKKAVFIRAPRGYRFTAQDVTVALSHEPKTAQAYRARGAMLLDHGDLDRALSDLNQSLKMKPDDAGALADRGVIYVWKGNEALARRDFDAAAVLEPRNAVVFRGRGLMALNAGHYKEAIENFTTSLDYDQANVFALQKRAAAFDLSGNLAQAIADSEHLTRLHPDYLNEYEMRARMYQRAGQPDKAVGEAQAVIAANPRNAVALRVAGVIYALIGKDADSASAFTQSLAIDPTETTYLVRAKIRRRSDIAGEAADINAALKLAPASAQALLLRAHMQRDAGRYADALASLNFAIDAHPDEPDLLVERAVNEALNKQDYLADRDFAAARGKAVMPSAHNSLCWSQATAGIRLQAALDDCRAALAVAPADPSVLDSRGFVLLRLGRLDDSIASYNAALKLRPHQAATLYGRGIAELRKGDTASGKADLAAAAKESPDVAADFASYGIQP